MQSQPSQAFKIIEGDVTEVLKTLHANFFDAVLSDPPYGISFMGKEWDRGVPSAATYRELSRVLKPGAFGLHFGGTRMWHRLAVNLEDAGFELRDTVMWLYGSGFPKSHNISKALDKAAGAEREVVGERKQRANGAGTAGGSFNDCPSEKEYITVPATAAAKQWDGYGTALKPAWEPALLVQKPLSGTFANNALTHGCGGLNIDGCRVGFVSEADRQESTAKNQHADFGTKPLTENNAYGDWSMVQPKNYDPVGRFPANLILDDEAGEALGNAQRFFYCAKVSAKERNAGFDGKNNHPTLKPIALTEYLARLLLVPARTDGQPRRILVPFSGAGSEMIGCLKAGWDEVWGIELDGAYAKIAEARVKHYCPWSEVLNR